VAIVYLEREYNMLIIFSIFSFFMSFVCFRVVNRKWKLKFKNSVEENLWHQRHDKSFKIIAVILLLVGATQLIRGIIELFGSGSV